MVSTTTNVDNDDDDAKSPSPGRSGHGWENGWGLNCEVINT